MSSMNLSGQPMVEFTITGFDHLPQQKVLGFLILLSYCLILLCCGTNICIIATDRRLHRPMYLLICNLAVVDVMFSTAACTTMIAVLLTKDKTISYYSCMSCLYFYHLGDITEALGLSLMALDRMFAISQPLRYTSILTNPRILMIILLSWLIGFSIMGKVVSIANQLPYCQPIIKYVFCDYPAVIRASCVNPEPYLLVPTIIGVWIVAGLFPFILLTYVKLIHTVLRLPNNENRHQVFYTVFSHLIPVASYYSPKLIAVLLTRIGLKLDLTERNALLIISTILPPLMNPAIYCLRTKEIRSRLIHILSKAFVVFK